jgi:hypothetical protein
MAAVIVVDDRYLLQLRDNKQGIFFRITALLRRWVRARRERRGG